MAVVVQRPELLRRLRRRWDERRERRVPVAGGYWASGGGQAPALAEEAVTEAALAMAEAVATESCRRLHSALSDASLAIL